MKANQNNITPNFFRASASDFKKIPGSPIAYWVSERVRQVFSISAPLDVLSDIKQGLATCNNDLFLRLWFEIDNCNVGFGITSSNQALKLEKRWYPYNKGGGYRKWYGNNEYLVNWQNGGEDIHRYSNLPMEYSGAPVRAKQFYFREGITYGLISSFGFSARRVFGGFIFDVGGSMIFPNINANKLQGFLCSKLTKNFIAMLNPTLNYQVGDVQKLPIYQLAFDKIDFCWHDIIAAYKSDWDSYETSWDFEKLPLLDFRFGSPDCRLKEAYSKLREHWKEITLEMQKLEEENNRIFIEAYGLQDELTPDVPLKEITLTCNPYYRYGVDSCQLSVDSKEFPINEELEERLLADTMKEFISYSVGCMFGRYSLDLPGLVIASQGETIEDYSLKHNEILNWGISTNVNSDPQDLLDTTTEKCSLLPDWDNVIPILDSDWFTDDISERFRKFLRVTFGDKHYAENLAFIEEAIGKDIRKYFLKDFYTDHVKKYKKRPIYWMFSSPKGYFNALIYMHRYKADTVSVILNDYLKEFQVKVSSHKKHLEGIISSESMPNKEKIKAQKEIEVTIKILKDLDDYEKTIIYPLATEKLEIDLDDGVKVNYQKFGEALRKIPGLDTKEE